MIEIPQDMLLQIPQPQPLPRGVRLPAADPAGISTTLDIDCIWQQHSNLTPAELSTSAILASTVKEVTKVNDFIIAALDRQRGPIFSVDSVVSNDPNDVLNFSVEYLSDKQQSGLPPLRLEC